MLHKKNKKDECSLCKKEASVITIARVHSRMYANRTELLENSLKFQFSLERSTTELPKRNIQQQVFMHIQQIYGKLSNNNNIDFLQSSNNGMM